MALKVELKPNERIIIELINMYKLSIREFARFTE